MLRNKKLLYSVIGVIVLLVTGILVYFFLIPRQSISIINNSKYYAVKFKNTQSFNLLLNNWGIWKENGVFRRNIKPYNKITSIKIEITDTKQTNLIQVDEKKEMLWSSNMDIKNNSLLIVYVYLSPNLLKDPQLESRMDVFNRLFFIATTQSLYYATLREVSVKEQSDEPFYAQIRSILRSSQEIPFTVSKFQR